MRCRECGSPANLVNLPHAVLCQPCIDNDTPYWFMRRHWEQWFNVNPGHIRGEHPHYTWVRGWVAQHELAKAARCVTPAMVRKSESLQSVHSAK